MTIGEDLRGRPAGRAVCVSRGEECLGRGAGSSPAGVLWYSEVIDADLGGYFDSIPHAERMQCAARRVSDQAVLHLVKLWLDGAVEETDARGRT